MKLNIAVVVVMLLTPALSRAEDGEARRHFERGMKAYNLQEFGVALNEFTQAYVEKPVPDFLFNIAQAQRQLGRYEAAAKSFRLYLASQPSAPNREQVVRLIEQTDKAAQTASDSSR